MTERSAHWMSAVLPRVRVRQWVLSLPFWLRHRIAYDHDLALAIWRVAARAIEARYRRAARTLGATTTRGGSVTVIQRFGGDLRTNIHFHGLFLDGVYEDGESTPRFIPVRPPSVAEMEALLRIIVVRIERLLHRRGVRRDDSERDDSSSALTDLQARSVLARGTEHLGREEHETEDRVVRRIKARIDDFDLDADVSVGAKRRGRLEHLCRYILRPPFALERLRALADGRIALELRKPWSSGVTHVAFEPDVFLERLASLVPGREPTPFSITASSPPAPRYDRASSQRSNRTSKGHRHPVATAPGPSSCGEASASTSSPANAAGVSGSSLCSSARAASGVCSNTSRSNASRSPSVLRDRLPKTSTSAPDQARI